MLSVPSRAILPAALAGCARTGAVASQGNFTTDGAPTPWRASFLELLKQTSAGLVTEQPLRSAPPSEADGLSCQAIAVVSSKASRSVSLSTEARESAFGKGRCGTREMGTQHSNSIFESRREDAIGRLLEPGSEAIDPISGQLLSCAKQTAGPFVAKPLQFAFATTQTDVPAGTADYKAATGLDHLGIALPEMEQQTAVLKAVLPDAPASESAVFRSGPPSLAAALLVVDSKSTSPAGAQSDVPAEMCISRTDVALNGLRITSVELPQLTPIGPTVQPAVQPATPSGLDGAPAYRTATSSHLNRQSTSIASAGTDTPSVDVSERSAVKSLESIQQSLISPAPQSTPQPSSSAEFEVRLRVAPNGGQAPQDPSVLRDSAKVNAHDDEGTSEANEPLDLRSMGLFDSLRQSPSESTLRETNAAPGHANDKQVYRRKSGPDLRDSGTSARAMSLDDPRVGVGLIPAPGSERPSKLEPSLPNQVDDTVRKAMPLPVAPSPQDLSTESNGVRTVGNPASLAFALRLKPLEANVTALPQVASPAPASLDLAAKSAGVSSHSSRSPVPLQAPIEASSDSHNKGEDSSRRDHATDAATNLASQLTNSSRTKAAEPPAPGENHSVDAREEPLRTTLVDQLGAGSVLPERPGSDKSNAPSARAATATSFEPEAPPASTRLANEISLQISTGGDQRVDIHLVERAGEVHVSVRTPDSALADEMRQDLGSLTGKLAQSGYATEHFTPLNAGSSSLTEQRSGQKEQDPSSGQRPDSQRGGSGQQQHAQDERRERLAWVEELEDSLA